MGKKDTIETIKQMVADGVLSQEIAEKYFHELKENEDERMRKWIINYLSNRILNSSIIAEKVNLKKAIAWLEKKGEQKIADNLEPKFKVGDWVVYNRNDNSREIMQIYDIKDGRYYFTDNVHFSWSIKECDEKSHFWSIEDAKTGDVLVVENIIFIYKRTLGGHIVSYCKLINDVFEPTVDARTCCCVGNRNVHPATKEQRDTLIKAMTDAGYTFNLDKGELRKLKFGVGDAVKSKSQPMLDARKIISIDKDCYWCEDRGCIGFDWEADYELVEQKSAWSEEDDYNLQCIIAKVTSDIQKGNIGRNYELIRWLKFIKDRVQPQPKQEWSEEDERMIKFALIYFRTIGAAENSAVIKWLNSIKNRELPQPKQEWRPSDEQMDALNDVISSKDIKYDVLSELWKDLKKLKEK